MYSKLLSSLLGRYKSQCKSQPGPASEKTTMNDSHLPTDGGCVDGGFTSPVAEPSLLTAGHSLLLDDCQLIDHAPCSRCSESNSNYEVVNMRHFALSWNVKYLGSFPISNTTPEHVTTRLERFEVPPTSKPVTLSISLLGVRIHNHDNLIMSHSLRRVCSVIGRAQLCQVAYTAMEAAGQTYRRQCHVFQTDAIHQVEEIESVLGNAFQAAIVAKTNSTPTRPTSMSTPLPLPSLPKSEKRASSTAFMSRLLGKGRETIEEKSRRKRRPVSAVFSSAIHRLSSTTSMANKRMSSIDSPPRKDLRREETVARITTSVQEEPISSKIKASTEPKLVFDDKLAEWIYPVDDALEAQLENVNYFVKSPSRELLVRNLLSHSEGAFVVRYSESKRQCLALSVRVPPTHNPACISHYLIVRNQNGYRIKSCDKHFPSLQMLITHHSVMPERLPVTLMFVQWNATDWVEKVNDVSNTLQASEKRNSYKTTHSKHSEIGDNRKFYNTQDYRIEDYVTPKRRSRVYLENYRHSRFIDIA